MPPYHTMDENRTEYTALPKKASDDHPMNTTTPHMDVQILESNTIEPEKDPKLRKSSSSSDEKNNYNEEDTFLTL